MARRERWICFAFLRLSRLVSSKKAVLNQMSTGPAAWLVW